jgi:hypothetical protein
VKRFYTQIQPTFHPVLFVSFNDSLLIFYFNQLGRLLNRKVTQQEKTAVVAELQQQQQVQLDSIQNQTTQELKAIEEKFAATKTASRGFGYVAASKTFLSIFKISKFSLNKSLNFKFVFPYYSLFRLC